MIDKLRDKIKGLEQEVRKKFEITGLVTNVSIKGHLNTPENPLHLEYKKRENTKQTELGIRFFRTQLLKVLLANYHQIFEIKKDYKDNGFYKEIIITNPQIKLNNNEEVTLRYRILQDIKKELGNYLERKL